METHNQSNPSKEVISQINSWENEIRKKRLRTKTEPTAEDLGRDTVAGSEQNGTPQGIPLLLYSTIRLSCERTMIVLWTSSLASWLQEGYYVQHN